jgi:hypothetical protein
LQASPPHADSPQPQSPVEASAAQPVAPLPQAESGASDIRPQPHEPVLEQPAKFRAARHAPKTSIKDRIVSNPFEYWVCSIWNYQFWLFVELLRAAKLHLRGCDLVDSHFANAKKITWPTSDQESLCRYSDRCQTMFVQRRKVIVTTSKRIEKIRKVTEAQTTGAKLTISRVEFAD